MPGNPKECREHARCCLEHAAAIASRQGQFPELGANLESSCGRVRSKQEISGDFGGRVSCREAFTAARSSSLIAQRKPRHALASVCAIHCQRTLAAPVLNRLERLGGFLNCIDNVIRNVRLGEKFAVGHSSPAVLI